MIPLSSSQIVWSKHRGSGMETGQSEVVQVYHGRL